MPAAAGGSAHVHARGRGVGPLGDRVVHPDLAVVQISTVHGIASLRGVVLIFKIDEGKAPAAARVTIQHYLDLLQRPVLLELRLELPLAGVQRQPEHPQALAGLRVVAVALVTSSARHRGPGMVTASPSSSSSRVLPLSGRRRPGPRPGP